MITRLSDGRRTATKPLDKKRVSVPVMKSALEERRREPESGKPSTATAPASAAVSTT
jgi:hypothetical protein